MEKIEHLSPVQVRNEQPDIKTTCTTSLHASSHFIKKPLVFKGIKILGFIALLILVLLLYGFDIYTKFQDHATTFKTKSHEADNLDMPPITICMDNGLKPTVMKKYGIETIFDFSFGSEVVVNMFSVWDVFVEGAYIINRDFQIIFINPMTWEAITLTKGHNYYKQNGEGTGFDINVSEYHTVLAGTCYQITSDFPLHPPNWIMLDLQFNESLSKTDIPQVIIVTYMKN